MNDFFSYPKQLKLRSSDIISEQVGGKALKTLLLDPFGLSALLQASQRTPHLEEIHFLHFLKYMNELLESGKTLEAEELWKGIKTRFLEKLTSLTPSLPERLQKEILNSETHLSIVDFTHLRLCLQKCLEERIGSQSELMKVASIQADALKIKTQKENKRLKNALSELGFSL